jgi:hypothetical protein
MERPRPHFSALVQADHRRGVSTIHVDERFLLQGALTFVMHMRLKIRRSHTGIERSRVFLGK